MDENKKNVEQNFAGNLASGKNKMKTVGIILIVGAVILLALFSAFVISSRKGMYRAQKIGGNGFGLESMPMNFESDGDVANVGRSKMMLESPIESATFDGSVESPAPMQVSTDKKIIKNGNVTVQVEKIDSAQKEIAEIAKGNGGNIFSSNIYQSGKNVKRGMVVVKVPVANFEKTFEEIKKVATLVLRESTSGSDVTAEYQDLEVQIKNKQAEEQSYVRILDQAGKISDVLEVTQQISRTRNEIERLQGQIRFMNSQTDMSTIDVSLSEDQDVAIVDSWRPLQVAKDAINSLVKSVQGFVDFVIVLVITFIPVMILYLLVIFILFLIGRKIYRKIRKNKDAQ